MAISVEDTYPGRSTPADANYPEGSTKNETVPKVSDDGMPADKLWFDDFEGLKQSVMRSAGTVPTLPGNVPDTATASQILKGLIEIAQGRAINYGETGLANAYVLDVLANQQAPDSLFNHQKFCFVAGNDNTGASTIDFETLITGAGVKVIVNATNKGDILAGNYYEVEYRAGTDDVKILNVANPEEMASITGTVAASALNAGLKAGTLKFRDSSLPNGISNLRSFGDLSLVIPSGATMGTVDTIQSRLILLAIDNGGTIELAIANEAGGNNLDETTLISTTALDVTSDANNVIYSTTARANVPFRAVGFIDSTQAVAGTWATNPSTVQGAGGNALTAMSSLGYGQTLQNLTASRAFGVTYYNPTGKPIYIYVSTLGHTNNDFRLYVSINGEAAIQFGGSAMGGVSVLHAVQGHLIIQPNESYNVTVNQVAALDYWSERR